MGQLSMRTRYGLDAVHVDADRPYFRYSGGSITRRRPGEPSAIGVLAQVVLAGVAVVALPVVVAIAPRTVTAPILAALVAGLAARAAAAER